MLFSLTNPEIAILMMGMFLFAVLLGFPIAFTLMAMGIGFGYFAYYDATMMEHIFDNRIFQLFVQNTYTVMDNNVLTAVPLFLFMGYLVERAGIVAKLFFAIRLAAHRLPASMAVAALITCTLFSTATGIIGAVVALIGMAIVLYYLDLTFPELELLRNTVMIIGLFLGIFLLGIVITWISTFIATPRDDISGKSD